MTRPPNFDDLVDTDLDPAERERLRRVHDLLVTAGPPPELTPEFEAGPTLAMTLGRSTRRRVQRRTALLAAAVVVLLLAFLAGYIAGNTGDNGLANGRLIKLRGTQVAPAALASLRLQPVDASGNWPMRLSVRGLPKLPPKGYYEVFLMRKGKIYAPCGSFVVKDAVSTVSVQLNAPYRLHQGDSWVVTKQLPGARKAGAIVLKPLKT
jgi:hypothetical protein